MLYVLSLMIATTLSLGVLFVSKKHYDYYKLYCDNKKVLISLFRPPRS